MDLFRRIDHVELVPRDFEASIRFYTDVLGFRQRERMTIDRPPLRDIVFLELGDTTMELLQFDPVAPAAEEPQVGYRMMAIEVRDMDDALSYLSGHGIAPTMAPMPSGNGVRAEIQDPDGLPIELRQWL